MPTYTYKARNTEGKIVKGEMSSSAEGEVAKFLEERGTYPVSIKRIGESSAIPRFLKRKRVRVKGDEKILFTRQLQSMINAGISLTGSLRALAEQSESQNLKGILEQVRKDVEGGATFSQALSKHPSLYSDLYVNLIKAGEEGGVMDEMMDRIGDLLEYEAETKARIRSATFYPALVIGELFIAFGVIIKFVFPRFKSLFASHNAALPLPTIIMMNVSDFTARYGLHVLVGAIVVALGLRMYIRTSMGKEIFHRLLLSIPIFGDIILKTLMSRFARVLGALLDSGLPVIRALDLVVKTMGNRVIADEVIRMREGIKRGQTLAQPVREGGIFPPAVVKMLEVGEHSGDLNTMLFKVSSFYDRQLDYKIRNLTTVLEPILLVILGVSVLFVALAVFLPMWNLMQVMTGS